MPTDVALPEFTFQDSIHGVIIDQPKTVLASIDQYACTDFIDRSRDTVTIVKDLVNSFFREERCFCSSIGQLMLDILTGAEPVVMIKDTFHVNALPDRFTFLKRQTSAPEFFLS